VFIDQITFLKIQNPIKRARTIIHSARINLWSNKRSLFLSGASEMLCTFTRGEEVDVVNPSAYQRPRDTLHSAVQNIGVVGELYGS
jgi:hypothetical protein